MRNAFLIVRFVFFALLANLGLLSLIFASWNINSTIATGLSVPATPIFLIFTTCALFFCLILGLAELLRPQAKTSVVVFECVWTAIISIFQLGSAISITINGSSGVCGPTSDWGVCASSSLLVPTSWLNSLIASAYFFVLFITSMGHARGSSGIWYKSIYSVAWFGQQTLTGMKIGGDNFDDEDMRFDYTEDIENTSSRKRRYGQDNTSAKVAPWAESANIRRGMDNPFGRREERLSTRPSSTSTETPLPTLPLKLQPKEASRNGPAGSRFIEKFRESRTLSRSETTAQYGTHFLKPDSPFPQTVPDHDLPIPLPRLSEWIRADALKGITVHTMPRSP